jgi:hypothetical protein
MFACLAHWRKLPREHQQAIWREYRPGQEIRKDPTPAYLLVQARAVLVLAIIDRIEAELIERQRKYVAMLEGKTTGCVGG